ncbi:hypothetical protein CR201_G0001189 [Pongo abelii]|uniref:Uncharacterized protein n=1 Tax=Pongo abelii TaxID=9601 RepID=A0A2J8XLQ9_PONAB|nr:hypothetical protein CR201_G0001189 [Pongo abelii]
MYIPLMGWWTRVPGAVSADCMAYGCLASFSAGRQSFEPLPGTPGCLCWQDLLWQMEFMDFSALNGNS